MAEAKNEHHNSTNLPLELVPSKGKAKKKEGGLFQRFPVDCGDDRRIHYHARAIAVVTQRGA